jgi:hypothetical protein
VKGHVYQKMKENVASTLDGGVDRLLERIEQQDIRDFFRQRFLGGSWYDALPMAPLSYAHARLAGEPLHRFTRERGRVIAEHDVPGIYKALLRLFSPSTHHQPATARRHLPLQLRQGLRGAARA